MENNTSAVGHWKYLRILVGIAATIPAAFTFLLIRTNIDEVFHWKAIAFLLFPITLALVGWWFASCGHHASHRARIKCAVIGGAVLGFIGFLIGFVGPLIFAPEANQGPLLGIIFTGPIGFIVGFYLGALYGFIKVRTSDPKVKVKGE